MRLGLGSKVRVSGLGTRVWVCGDTVHLYWGHDWLLNTIHMKDTSHMVQQQKRRNCTWLGTLNPTMQLPTVIQEWPHKVENQDPPCFTPLVRKKTFGSDYRNAPKKDHWTILTSLDSYTLNPKPLNSKPLHPKS